MNGKNPFEMQEAKKTEQGVYMMWMKGKRNTEKQEYRRSAIRQTVA